MNIPPQTILVLMTFWFVLLALMEMSVTHALLTARVHLLTGFLAALYAILPLVLVPLTDTMGSMAFSPFGYVIHLAQPLPDRWMPDVAPAGLNVVLFLVLMALIVRRYRSIPLRGKGESY